MKKTLFLLHLISLYSLLFAQEKAQNNNSTISVNGKTFIDLNKNGKLDMWEDTRLSLDKRIDAIIAQMTNEEKASLLIGTGMPGVDALIGPIGKAKEGLVPGAAGGTAALDRFGIPATVLSDGPAGLRIEPTRKNDKKSERRRTSFKKRRRRKKKETKRRRSSKKARNRRF